MQSTTFSPRNRPIAEQVSALQNDLKKEAASAERIQTIVNQTFRSAFNFFIGYGVAKLFGATAAASSVGLLFVGDGLLRFAADKAILALGNKFKWTDLTTKTTQIAANATISVAFWVGIVALGVLSPITGIVLGGLSLASNLNNIWDLAEQVKTKAALSTAVAQG